MIHEMFQNSVSSPIVTRIPTSSAMPVIWAMGNSGMRTGSAAPRQARRKRRCVTRIMIQTKMPPNSATPNR